MNKEAIAAQRSLAQLGETISYTLLGLNIYFNCYWLFDHWGWTSRFTDEILQRFVTTGLLDGGKGQFIVLFFLILTLASAPGRRSVEIDRRSCLWWLGIGLLLFFCGPLVFSRLGNPLTTCLVYMVITVAGYLMIMQAGGRLIRSMRLPWDTGDPFGKKQAGFPQEQRRLGGDGALRLQSKHQWKQEKRTGWINLINPQRGILILGSPGCGKSHFIIEPLMRQLIEKGHSMLVYDYKYPALSSLAYRWFQQYRYSYPGNAGFYCVHLGDLARSHRCNLLEPATLEWVADALGAARTMLLSMNPSWAGKQGDFFVESPVNFLGALIWYLRKYKGGQYCTLPHVIELAQTAYDRLFVVLKEEDEIKALIEPFEQAYHNKNWETLDSMIASARIPLARLASPNLYYVLTGSDLSLDINNFDSPKILCLAGDPARMAALSPVLSLYIDRINQLCNQPGRYPCAMICDEFGTVRAYSMSTTIATGRANRIVPILAVQDLNQLRTHYSRHEADLFLDIAGNVFCGQVGGETAKWMSERFPPIQKEKPSVSSNSTDTSVSTTVTWEPTVSQATIAGLSSGEFVGVLSDDPDNPLELKVFHARILREEIGAGKRQGAEAGDEPVHPLPPVRAVDDVAVRKHYEGIQQDIKDLVAREFDRVSRGELAVEVRVGVSSQPAGDGGGVRSGAPGIKGVDKGDVGTDERAGAKSSI